MADEFRIARTPQRSSNNISVEDIVLTCSVPSSFGSLVLLPQNYTHLNVNRLMSWLPSSRCVHLHSYCLCLMMASSSTMIMATVSFHPFSGALQTLQLLSSSLHSLLHSDLLHTNKLRQKWKTHYLTTSWRCRCFAKPSWMHELKFERIKTRQNLVRQFSLRSIGSSSPSTYFWSKFIDFND